MAVCEGDTRWLPNTPLPTFDKPLPHPEPDCPFYQAAWQTFLVATQTTNGLPSFLSYPTIEDVFGGTASAFFPKQNGRLLSLAPRVLKGSNDPNTDQAGIAGGTNSTELNAGVRQAAQGGLGGVLLDLSGQPIFYSIHMNSIFADFIRDQKLTTKTALQTIDPNLEFPKGSVEFKSAWKIISNAGELSTYIAADALVPMLKRVGGTIIIDDAAPPRLVQVGLLGFHVVFVLQGHPEFIWATFEHVDSNGIPDLAPAATALPSENNGLPGGLDGVVSNKAFTLYRSGTSASAANMVIADADLANAFDVSSQRFVAKGTPLQTSIYRIFPTSKQATLSEDDDIVALNSSMAMLFGAATVADIRQNYRLVGAVWLDRPDLTFLTNKQFKNPPGVTPDDGGAVVAGEDGLSSMTMESFTQFSSLNCFSCHDTRPVHDPVGGVLMPAAKMGLSHILSRFVAQGK